MPFSHVLSAHMSKMHAHLNCFDLNDPTRNTLTFFIGINLRSVWVINESQMIIIQSLPFHYHLSLLIWQELFPLFQFLFFSIWKLKFSSFFAFSPLLAIYSEIPPIFIMSCAFITSQPTKIMLKTRKFYGRKMQFEKRRWETSKIQILWLECKTTIILEIIWTLQ